RIAPALLPHLQGRPVTMKRYPNGVDDEYFYEKNAPKHRPDWVKTAPIWSRHNRRHINYLLVEDLPTLTWLANLASLEIHPSLPRSPVPKITTAHPWCSSPWLGDRPPISCNVHKSACGCAKCLTTGDSKAFRRPPDRRACRCTFRSTRPRATTSPSRSPMGLRGCWNTSTRNSSSRR